MMGILLSSFYIFKKAIKYTAPLSQVSLSVLWCLLLSLFYVALPDWFPSLAAPILIYSLSIVLILILTKIKPDTVISSYLLSLGFSYSFFYISSAIMFLILSPLLSAYYTTDLYFIDFDSPVFLLLGILTLALQLFLSYLLFRIRRFKNGFPFLLKGYAVILALIVAGALLFFATLMRSTYEPADVYFFVAGILIVGVGIYIWIRRGITVFQWRRTMLRNADILESELAEEKAKNEQLTAKLEVARSASHKIIYRLEAMELKIARQTGSEISEEFINIEDIQK